MVLALMGLAMTAIEERLVYQPNLSDVRIPLTDAVNELWEALLDGEERMVERGW